MKPHKYTHKEINDAAMAARKEAELIYTYEKVKDMHPIDVTHRVETRLSTQTFTRHDNHNIEHFIDELRHEQKCGATHFCLSWSTGDWADDEPLELECIKMKTETPAEWDARIERTREKYLNDAYAKVQNVMVKHNEQLNLYLALKAQFEPAK